MNDIETLLAIIENKDTVIAELQGRQQMAAVIQADSDKTIAELRAELDEWRRHDCAKMATGFPRVAIKAEEETAVGGLAATDYYAIKAWREAGSPMPPNPLDRCALCGKPRHPHRRRHAFKEPS